MRLLITIVISLFSVINATAQANFLVYQCNGKVKHDNSKNDKALLVGEMLKSTGSVWLDKGASVTLICDNYSSFTISARGLTRLSGFGDSCLHKVSTSVTKNYFKFVWKQLTSPHGSPEDNRRHYMENTGAVVRGCPGISIDPAFDTINNVTGDLTIRWVTKLKPSRLRFVLFDAEKGGNELFSREAPVGSISVSELKKHAGGNNELFWTIMTDGNEMCERRVIRNWENSEYQSYLSNILDVFPKGQSAAERSYAKGFVLEANHFYAEALQAYKNAVSLKPGEKRYRYTLSDFRKKFY